MLEKINDLPVGVVGLKASGEVTESDYKKVMQPLLDGIHREGKKTPILYHFTPEFTGFTMGAAWQDFRLGMRHMRLFAKCAVVTEKEWLRKSTQLAGAMLPCPIEVFHEHEFAGALDWLATPESERISHTLHGDKGVLVIEPKEALRKEDFDMVALTIDPWIEQNGSLNGIVIHTKKFPGWEDFGSVVNHFMFVRDHHKKVKRVAVAADGAFAEFAPKISQHFVKAKIENFDYDDLDDAVEWASGSND
jgi:hypothetical protein